MSLTNIVYTPVDTGTANVSKEWDNANLKDFYLLTGKNNSGLAIVATLRSAFGNSMHLCLATKMKKKTLFFAGLICLLLVIADLVAWIIIATPEKSFDTAVSEYVSLFPKFIASPGTLTLLNIILLLMAIGCFIFSIQKNSSSFSRRLCYILIVLSGVLVFWNLFSLM